MKTWDDVKNEIKESDLEGRTMIEEAEALTSIISPMIKQRKELGLSQRELAAMCSIPQSSLARIESFRTTPRLDTIIKILSNLGLQLNVTARE